MKFEDKKNIMINYWINEKEQLGLKTNQFNLKTLSSYQIRITLRKLRKNKKVIYKRKRWFLNK